MSSKRTLGRTCSDCSIGIYDQSKTGRCRRCHIRKMGSDPAVNQRIGETLRRKCAENPFFYARKAAVMNRNRANAIAANPELWRLQGQRLAANSTPEQEANRRAALIRFNKRNQHPWLPDEYRAQYRDMIRNKHFKAREAKAMILADIEAKAPKLSPFERQERALANGAALAANDAAPSPYAAQKKWSVG